MSNFLNFFGQNSDFSYLSIILITALVVFLITWFKEPRRLINGILFTIFMLLLVIWIAALISATGFKTLLTIYEVILALIFAFILLCVAFSWIFFLWNAYFVWKHESHTLPNLLTLFIGIILIFIWLIVLIGPFKYAPAWVKVLLSAAPAILVYLLLVAYNFLVNLILYQFVPRRYNQDYLIVLGAGLANGESVTLLLANRINRAIQFAQKQVAKGHKCPKIIMSGGQGKDEKLPEAKAMGAYALDRGIKQNNLLYETRSQNTYQNLLYSKKIAAADHGNIQYRAKFFSNNYHIFRASLYAKMAKTTANGVGCYTRPYFLPNAIVREFAGIFVMNKKRHLLFIALIIIFFMIQAVLVGLNINL